MAKKINRRRNPSEPDDRGGYHASTTDALIRQLFHDDAEQWKDTPNASLGGEKPRTLLDTPRESLLRDLLIAASWGDMS